jgi:outer membrane autotransporter protein
MHVVGALGLTDGTTSFGGGMAFGQPQGWYAGGSLGLMTFDNVDGSSLGLSAGVGYSLPLQQRSRWQLCPGATMSFGFGPDQDVGGTQVDVSTRSFSLGASVGTTAPLNKTVTLLPFASLAIANTNVKASAGGVSASDGDTYMLLGFGAGFQFSPNLVLRPSLSFALGNDVTDDTLFGIGLTFALPQRSGGGRR